MEGAMDRSAVETGFCDEYLITPPSKFFEPAAGHRDESYISLAPKLQRVPSNQPKCSRAARDTTKVWQFLLVPVWGIGQQSSKQRF